MSKIRPIDRWWDFHSPYAYRDDNLKRMGFKSNRAYLHSELWASIRARVFKRDSVCESCGKRQATHVHHRSHDPATLNGDDINSLTALCASCLGNAQRRLPPGFRMERAHTRLHAANTYVNKRARRAARYRRSLALATAAAPPRLVRTR